MIDLELLEEEKPIPLGLQGENGGGTNNYNELDNKPKINGVELQGDLTLEELGIIVNTIKDILINGASIIDKDGNAIIPIANAYNTLGLVYCANGYGLKVSKSGELSVDVAQISNIDNRTVGARLITTERLDYAVKCAMTDGKGAEWTSEEKAMAQNRIGLGEYRTLFDVTLEEQVGAVTFNTDMDGNPFEVEEVIIIIENCQVENGRIRVIDTTNKFNDFVNLYFNNSNTTTPKKHVITIGKQVDGTHCVERTLTDNTGTAFETISQPPWRAYGRRNVKYLTRFQIDNNGGNFSVGTRIWVGGR